MGDIDADDITSQVVFEDDAVRISMAATPSSKKGSQYMDLRFYSENLSGSKLKSVKLSLSKSSWLRPREKEKSSFKLGVGRWTTVKMRCSKYSGDGDCIKCKLSYRDVHSGSLVLQIKTHSFVIGNSDTMSEEDVMSLMENEDRCGCSATSRLKVPKDRTCADALDILSTVWRLSSVSRSEKKALLYGKLMLGKELVVYVRISSKKNALEVTAKGQDQEFVDSMLD